MSIRTYATSIMEQWRTLVRPFTSDVRILLISHGMDVELGAISCALDAGYPGEIDFGDWGGSFGYFEGVRVTFDYSWKERCIGIELLRLSPEQQDFLESL